MNSIVSLCLWGGTLLAGPAALLLALRLATRPADGFLTQLGAGRDRVYRSSLEKLESSARTLRRVGTTLLGLIALVVWWLQLSSP